MNLEELKAEEERIKNLVPSDIVALRNIQAQIAQMEQQQESEQRVQVQEEKVQSITLPYDFNTIFDNKKANDIILELIQEFQRQSNAEHNAEIEQLHTTQREWLKAAEDKEVQMTRQIADLQHQLEQESGQLAQAIVERDQARKELQQVTLERDDAIAKRDAAAREHDDAKREIERLNGHIDDLRKDAAVGAKNSYKVQDIGASDKLSQLVKESNEEKAARALARWNASNPELAAPKLEVAAPAATFPATEPQHDTVHNGDTEAANASAQPPIEAPTFQGAQEVPAAPVGVANQEPGVHAEGASIEERVAALESKVAALEGKTAGQAA